MSRARAARRFALVLAAVGAATAGARSAAPPAATAAASAPGTVPDDLLRGLRWRSIGPYRGGRVVAVAGLRDQPYVYYFGGTGGGIWKTTDGGIRWSNVSDGQLGTGSVGAVAVAESDANVVYAGMGEGCIRGNVSHGDGVYRSTDGGQDLDARRPARHAPDRPRSACTRRTRTLVYVAALGHAFGPNTERGVFRSKDGGRTWRKVLYVDDTTGAIDLDMDPTNPRVLYAAFWQVVRTPWSLESGGPGSGLYKTTDGGDTWKKIGGRGPAQGAVGPRWASPSRPRTRAGCGPSSRRRTAASTAATTRARPGSARTTSAGCASAPGTTRTSSRTRRTRTRCTSSTPASTARRTAGAPSTRSACRTATTTTSGSPRDDPLRMIESNDGGANVSFDGGRSWSRQDNQPTAQFYHVITDTRFPYRVYGAQQDNTHGGPGQPPATRAGIDRTQWYPVGGGESGYIAPSPADPQVVYAGCYGGQITRYDHRTGQERDVTVWPENPMGWRRGGDEVPLPVDLPHRVLAARPQGALHRRRPRLPHHGRGPDLGGDQPRPHAPRRGQARARRAGRSPRTTPASSTTARSSRCAESPREKGVIWAGSDDGLVHVSRDGGKTWTNVTPREHAGVEPRSARSTSPPHHAGTAYLAATRYKLDDFKPYAWVTTDYGKTLAPHHRRPARDVVRRAPSAKIRPGAGSSTRGRRRACSSPSTTARAGSRCAWPCPARARPSRASPAPTRGRPRARRPRVPRARCPRPPAPRPRRRPAPRSKR